MFLCLLHFLFFINLRQSVLLLTVNSISAHKTVWGCACDINHRICVCVCVCVDRNQKELMAKEKERLTKICVSRKTSFLAVAASNTFNSSLSIAVDLLEFCFATFFFHYSILWNEKHNFMCFSILVILIQKYKYVTIIDLHRVSFLYIFVQSTHTRL